MRARIVLVFGLCIAGAVWSNAAESPEQCAACHEQGQKLKTSAHAGVSCASCHAGHEEFPHPAGIPKPECGQCHAGVVGEQARSVHAEELRKGNPAAPGCAVCHGDPHELSPARSAAFHKSVPDTCGVCHDEPAGKFATSVHGRAVAKGIAAAPVCTNCHGEHSILSSASKESTTHFSQVPETCGQCHGNVRLSRRFGLPADRVISFEQSFHGLAAKAGSQSVANCASCHGVHDILPSSDPQSKTNENNLSATCGACHPGAGRRFALGPIHQMEGQGEATTVRMARVFYQIFIPLLIGLMLLHNLGDWIRKVRARFAARRGAAFAASAIPTGYKRELRMYPLERLQHALLALSFIVLTWTGFALKYPDQWWARPLVMWESAFPLRGTIHRIASVVFMAVAFLHVILLIKNRLLRKHWTELWPRRCDIGEALGMFAYNMGLSSRKPIVSNHSYVEKAEYWAVVWGAVIMAVSGLILWANNLSLQWLPKSFIDLATTIHFYEAVLAALAIVVWHFYSVIFDPDVYPMDTAWLTGYSAKRREAEHAAIEAENEPQPLATVTEPPGDISKVDNNGSA